MKILEKSFSPAYSTQSWNIRSERTSREGDFNDVAEVLRKYVVVVVSWKNYGEWESRRENK